MSKSQNIKMRGKALWPALVRSHSRSHISRPDLVCRAWDRGGCGGHGSRCRCHGFVCRLRRVRGKVESLWVEDLEGREGTLPTQGRVCGFWGSVCRVCREAINLALGYLIIWKVCANVCPSISSIPIQGLYPISISISTSIHTSLQNLANPKVGTYQINSNHGLGSIVFSLN